MNRGFNFAGLYESLREDIARGCELVVADYGSTDIDLTAFNCRVVNMQLPFRRSNALNAAAAVAVNKHLFFIDADMLAPTNFAALIAKKVSPGICWFPICFSLYETMPAVVAPGNGWWRSSGHGMLGIMKEDFDFVCGWPEEFTSHGGEDDALYATCKRRLKVVRDTTHGLFHQWHQNDKEFKNKYY